MSFIDQCDPVESLKVVREEIFPRCLALAVELDALPAGLAVAQAWEYLRRHFEMNQGSRPTITWQQHGLRFLMFSLSSYILQAESAIGEGRSELAKTYLENAMGLRSQIQGYHFALLNNRKENIRRAANGRRLIGANSRERARTAAIKYRGRMSREGAAYLISEEIGLSPGRIKKFLSELYPGSEWSIGDSDASSDTA